MANVAPELLARLFQSPTPPPSYLGPNRFPGATASSEVALLDVLKDNFVSHHVFFNDKGFHK